MSGALAACGEDKDVDEVLHVVLRDREFYKNGGGLTVSGGEPFMQSEFLLALLQCAKESGIHTCVETSGAAKAEDMLKAALYTDIFLYDCKLAPGEKHRQYVGCDGVALHENLKILDQNGAQTILRCPIIPGVNDNAEHFAYILRLAKSLKNVLAVHIEPYHTAGIAKAADIGKNDIFVCESFDAASFKCHIKNTLLPILTDALPIEVQLY